VPEQRVHVCELPGIFTIYLSRITSTSQRLLLMLTACQQNDLASGIPLQNPGRADTQPRERI